MKLEGPVCQLVNPELGGIDSPIAFFYGNMSHIVYTELNSQTKEWMDFREKFKWLFCFI